MVFFCCSELRELYNTNAVQHFFNSVPMKLLNKTKTIYQPGCGQKVWTLPLSWGTFIDSTPSQASKSLVLFGTVKTRSLSANSLQWILHFKLLAWTLVMHVSSQLCSAERWFSHTYELIHAGDYVKFHAPVNEVQQYNDHALHFIYMYFSIHVVHVWSTPYNSPVNIEWCNFVLCERVWSTGSGWWNITFEWVWLSFVLIVTNHPLSG